MNLLCLRDFNEGDISAKAGDVIGLPEGVAHRLLDSWPGAWRKIDILEGVRSFGPVETAAIEAPDANKMMHAPTKAKAGKRK